MFTVRVSITLYVTQKRDIVQDLKIQHVDRVYDVIVFLRILEKYLEVYQASFLNLCLKGMLFNWCFRVTNKQYPHKTVWLSLLSVKIPCFPPCTIRGIINFFNLKANTKTTISQGKNLQLPDNIQALLPYRSALYVFHIRLSHVSKAFILLYQ